MSGNVTEVLAGFAASLQYDDLPGQVRDHCKKLLLDTLACAVAGHRGEETQQWRPWLRGWRNPREQRHWRRPAVARRRDNSQRLSYYRGHHVRHPSLDAHPRHAGGDAARVGDRRARWLVRPRPAGRAGRRECEVTTRIGIGSTTRHCGPRAGMGRACSGRSAPPRRSDGFAVSTRETMAKAFGLAGSQAAGTFAAWGTPTVKFHQCRGALSGLMAALLAEQKFLATREFLTAKDGGLFNTYSNGGRRGHRRFRTALGARADRVAAMAIGLVDPGHEHRGCSI